MNLGLPLEQHFEQLGGFDDDNDDAFLKGFKLGSAASNFDDLVGKLQHQFDALSVHILCYYQSYYPLTEAMENLQQNMDVDPLAGTKVDSFGMTPFHILALSQTPNLYPFPALLKAYKVGIMCTRDKFGSTPMLEPHRKLPQRFSYCFRRFCSSPLAWSGSMAVRGHLYCNE
jgi:hypothetical protein